MIYIKGATVTTTKATLASLFPNIPPLFKQLTIQNTGSNVVQISTIVNASAGDSFPIAAGATFTLNNYSQTTHSEQFYLQSVTGSSTIVVVNCSI
jgi:hypothetical protein